MMMNNENHRLWHVGKSFKHFFLHFINAIKKIPIIVCYPRFFFLFALNFLGKFHLEHVKFMIKICFVDSLMPSKLRNFF